MRSSAVTMSWQQGGRVPYDPSRAIDTMACEARQLLMTLWESLTLDLNSRKRCCCVNKILSSRFPGPTLFI